MVIVEDHAMVAQALSAALTEEGLDVLDTVGTAQQAAEMMGREAPDVALIDFRLPDGDGVELAAAMKARRPETQVLMLTAADDREVLGRAIDAGVAGFVHKSEPIEEVVRAIRAVREGECWFRPGDLAKLVGRARRPVPTVGHDLTEREREVLALLGQGASTQAMIETLVLSPHTVRNHVRNIMMKLGAHSKLEAVAIAARAGIVSVGGGTSMPMAGATQPGR
ncbi:MAG: response regulator transcription factor [Actinomycetota bacterium]|nr:response regulator transcription factor [Actinomycetota bacterium]